MNRLTPILIAASVAIATPALAAGTDKSAARAALAHNRALWSSQHVRDYRFRLRVTCFCAGVGKPVTVTVRNGKPVGAKGAAAGLATVPAMFKEIASALADPKSGDVTVRYDTHRGFPRSASVDRIKRAADDEIGWTMDRFRPLPHS